MLALLLLLLQPACSLHSPYHARVQLPRRPGRALSISSASPDEESSDARRDWWPPATALRSLRAASTSALEKPALQKSAAALRKLRSASSTPALRPLIAVSCALVLAASFGALTGAFLMLLAQALRVAVGGIAAGLGGSLALAPWRGLFVESELASPWCAFLADLRALAPLVAGPASALAS